MVEQGLRRGMSATAKIVVLIGAPMAFFALLLLIPHLDVFLMSSTFHVVIVGSIAACAFFTAAAAGFSAVRAGHGSILLVALGCLGLAIMMLAHGLTTPGALGQPPNAWIGRLPVMGIAIFAGCLALAATPRQNRAVALVVRAGYRALAVPVAALMLLAFVVVSNPMIRHGHAPVRFEGTFTTVLTVAAGLALVPAGAIFWRRWRFGRDPVQFALAAAAWYSTCALVALRLGRPWHMSWWDYHAYLLAGFGAATWAVVKETRRSGDAVGAMTRLALSDPVEQIARGYTETLRPLVAAVEAKDRYTHGHSERVCTLAARLALSMRLSPETVRAVAEGAYLHDIGKIAVPDALLNKPERLTEAERDIIEQHPVTGWEIVGRAPSLRHALAAVHHHHERWDGSGYPDGLLTADIPLAARVVALADVWDALTTDRSYRSAWTAERTAAYMLDERGRHFDPQCVDALFRLLEDSGADIRPSETSVWLPLDADVCHHRTTSTASAS